MFIHDTNKNLTDLQGFFFTVGEPDQTLTILNVRVTYTIFSSESVETFCLSDFWWLTIIIMTIITRTMIIMITIMIIMIRRSATPLVACWGQAWRRSAMLSWRRRSLSTISSSHSSSSYSSSSSSSSELQHHRQCHLTDSSYHHHH